MPERETLVPVGSGKFEFSQLDDSMSLLEKRFWVTTGMNTSPGYLVSLGIFGVSCRVEVEVPFACEIVVPPRCMSWKSAQHLILYQPAEN